MRIRSKSPSVRADAHELDYARIVIGVLQAEHEGAAVARETYIVRLESVAGAGETLANVGKLTSERTLLDFSIRAGRYVAQRQHEDGSWSYGADSHQAWSDSFHTAFILKSLSRTIEAVTDQPAVAAGTG